MLLQVTLEPGDVADVEGTGESERSERGILEHEPRCVVALDLSQRIRKRFALEDDAARLPGKAPLDLFRRERPCELPPDANSSPFARREPMLPKLHFRA